MWQKQSSLFLFHSNENESFSFLKVKTSSTGWFVFSLINHDLKPLSRIKNCEEEELGIKFSEKVWDEVLDKKKIFYLFWFSPKLNRFWKNDIYILYSCFENILKTFIYNFWSCITWCPQVKTMTPGTLTDTK